MKQQTFKIAIKKGRMLSTYIQCQEAEYVILGD